VSTYNVLVVLPSVSKKLGRTDFTVGKRSILIECHEKTTSCQFGRHKMYQRIARYELWPQMHKEMTQYVQLCLLCQQCKLHQLASHGLIERRRRTRSMKAVTADGIDPFPRQTTRKEFLLILMYMFIWCSETFTIQEANAKAIRSLDSRTSPQIAYAESVVVAICRPTIALDRIRSRQSSEPSEYRLSCTVKINVLGGEPGKVLAKFCLLSYQTYCNSSMDSHGRLAEENLVQGNGNR